MGITRADQEIGTVTGTSTASGVTTGHHGLKVSPTLWIITAALVAMALKLCIALNTQGTNDVYFFQLFAHDLAQHGLHWTYAHRPMFNHPPLTAYYLDWIYSLGRFAVLHENGIAFPFLLRLPGILADFGVILIMLWLRKIWGLPAWSLVLFALSPVSLMVSGFHGNSDPVIVFLVLVAACLCVRENPECCGVALALSCGVKVVPLFLLPIFFFFWAARGRALRFSLLFVATLAAISIEPLLTSPTLFVRNVLAYGSYWGLWGISYWLRLTGWSQFGVINYRNLPGPEIVVSSALKIIIILAVLIIAWRRRHLDGRALFASIGYAWLVFFTFAPGIAPQYFVWLMPFVLVLSPTAFAYITVASSLFLFFLYNTIAAGLPWNLAVSTNAIADRWAPWIVWPWLAFMAALAVAWKQARDRNPSLRLFSLESAHAPHK